MNEYIFPQIDFSAALIIGASGGIGGAMSDMLRRTISVETISRRDQDFDLLDETSIAHIAARYREEGRAFDFIFDATGALQANGRGPEKSFRAIDPAAMGHAFAVNAIGPALLIKHFTPLLVKDAPSVFASLSARVGSIGDNRLGGWVSYRAAKAALNQIIRCAAIETSRTRPKAALVALHPGTIETALTRQYAKGRYTATPQEAAGQMLAVLNNLTPKDTGKFLDYKGEEIVW